MIRDDDTEDGGHWCVFCLGDCDCGAELAVDCDGCAACCDDFEFSDPEIHTVPHQCWVCGGPCHCGDDMNCGCCEDCRSEEELSDAH